MEIDIGKVEKFKERGNLELARLHDDIQRLTNEAFKVCVSKEEVATQKSMVSCICSKLQNDKWAKKMLGY